MVGAEAQRVEAEAIQKLPLPHPWLCIDALQDQMFAKMHVKYNPNK